MTEESTSRVTSCLHTADAGNRERVTGELRVMDGGADGLRSGALDSMLTISNALRAARRWWWLLLLAALIAAGSAMRSAAATPRYYRAGTTMLVGRVNQQVNPNSEDFTLLDRLTAYYANFALRQPVLDAAATSLSPPTTGGEIAPRIHARAIAGTPFIELTYLDPDPRRAAAVANAVATQLVKQTPTPAALVDQQQAKFTKDQLNALQVEIGDGQAQIKQLEDDASHATSAAEIADLRDKAKELQAQIDGWRTNYANLLRLSTPSATNYLTIIEPAAIPTIPVGSSRTLIIGAGSMLSLVLAFAGVLLIEYFDDTLRRPGDVETQTRLPLLTTMPRHGRRGPNLTPFSALRNVVLDTAPAPPLRLLVVAPRKRSGVTYTAVGLAHAFARAGRRVVLIDSNFVAPTLHAAFGIPMRPGFADVIADAATAGHALSPTRQGIPNLLIVPAGEHSGTDDALGRPGLPAALDAILAQTRADVLIVDGGALSDATRTARLLAHYLSHTLLVVTARTRARTLRSIAETLAASGTEVAGVVFNQHGGSRPAAGPSNGKRVRLPQRLVTGTLNYFGFGLPKPGPSAKGLAYPPGSLASMGPATHAPPIPPRGPADAIAEE